VTIGAVSGSGRLPRVEPVLTATELARARAFDMMADAVLLADDSRRYVDVNGAAASLFGLPREALLGRRIEEFAPPPKEYDVEAGWQEFLREGQQQGLFPLVRPDGSRRMVEFRATANIVPNLHLSVLRDVTERLEHLQQFAKLSNNLPYVIGRYDRAHRILFVNESARRFLGIDPLAAVGRPVDDFLPAPLAARFHQAIDLALAGHQTDLDFQWPQPDGSVLELAARLLPEIADDGLIESALIITRDATAEKRAERARLEAMAREHEARERAERASKLAEFFVAVVGHDLRNPLNSILSGAWLIGQRAAEEPLQRVARRIETSAQRMARLIDQLLDFTRIRAGNGLPHEPRQMSLGALLSRMREELSPHETSITIRSEGSTDGCWDEDRLAQVFSNLLGNAVEHSPDGAAVEVDIDGLAPDRVEVTVRNPGTIDPESLEQIFEPFKQGRRAAGSRGLGLGLYTSREVVAAHGGTIEVTSTPGEDTCFRVVLPRASPARSPERG
jgi:PAS domain S-box-containing protein